MQDSQTNSHEKNDLNNRHGLALAKIQESLPDQNLSFSHHLVDRLLRIQPFRTDKRTAH